MSSVLDKYLNSLIEQKKYSKEKISKFLKSAKNSSIEISSKGKIKFEIEKTKFELKNKYKKLGEHVSKEFSQNKVSDFTYNEEFLKLNQEIEDLLKYISKIKNKKIKL